MFYIIINTSFISHSLEGRKGNLLLFVDKKTDIK